VLKLPYAPNTSSYHRVLTGFYIQRVVELQKSKADLASVINLQNDSNGTRRPLEVSTLVSAYNTPSNLIQLLKALI
jgi:hypothetical protein